MEHQDQFQDGPVMILLMVLVMRLTKLQNHQYKPEYSQLNASILTDLTMKLIANAIGHLIVNHIQHFNMVFVHIKSGYEILKIEFDLNALVWER